MGRWEETYLRQTQGFPSQRRKKSRACLFVFFCLGWGGWVGGWVGGRREEGIYLYYALPIYLSPNPPTHPPTHPPTCGRQHALLEEEGVVVLLLFSSSSSSSSFSQHSRNR